jgi:hypothetical protein
MKLGGVSIDRAWDAQLRQCRRYPKLAALGKNVNIGVIAVARELAGFIWDISRLAMSLARPKGARPGRHNITSTKPRTRLSRSPMQRRKLSG